MDSTLLILVNVSAEAQSAVQMVAWYVLELRASRQRQPYVEELRVEQTQQ